MPLINTQYDSIMRGYARRQARSRQELEERLERIHREIPELSALEEQITACQAEKVRAAVSQNREQSAELEERLTQLFEGRAELLAEHGLSLSDLEPVYTCPDCRDTGYIGEEKCHSFSYSWYEGEDREIMRRCVMDARMFIENFDSSFQNLLLLGAVGTGKTFLSNCIAKELMDTCHSVVYLTAFQLFELLSRAAFGSEKQNRSYQQTYPYIFDCDLLIIDDLGTELPKSFTVSQFFLCINERILRKKSTLISSNLDMEALRNIYSERALSRIISCYTIRQLPGSDIRIKKKLKPGRPAS